VNPLRNMIFVEKILVVTEGSSKCSASHRVEREQPDFPLFRGFRNVLAANVRDDSFGDRDFTF
jgi:hypothetical protein